MAVVIKAAHLYARTLRCVGGGGPSHDTGATPPPHLHAIPPRASGFKISHEAWDPAEPGYPLLRAAQGRAAAPAAATGRARPARAGVW